MWDKSIAWIPGLDLLDEIPAGYAAERMLMERVPRSRYEIKALSSAADEEFSTYVGQQQVSEPAKKRAEQVERLCEELQKLLVAGIAESPHHAVWLLLSKSAARKLDYDARVCPWEELKEAMTKCELAVVDILQSLLGRPIDGDTLTQATLPGFFGGLGLRMTSRCADAHFVARTRATEHLVRGATLTDQDFIDNQLMQAAQERLRVKEGEVNGAGDVMLADWANQTVNEGPW